jgi:hypothetical protein
MARGWRVLLGFKRRFAAFVEDGSKPHTIRAPRKTRPRVGEICYCYVDPRQKTMRLLGRWPCVKVEPVTLDFERCGIAYVLRITVGDQTLTTDEAAALAWRDGFRSLPTVTSSALDEMAQFWISSGRLTDDLNSRPWHGELIHWSTKGEDSPDTGTNNVTARRSE